MVDREITDGARIWTLLQAEIEGRDDPPLGAVTVEDASGETDADHVLEQFEVHDGTGRVAAADVQPNRLYLEFDRGLDAALSAASDAGLRTRPKATTPPGLLVFVERGAEVKRALDVLVAALEDS